MFGNLGELAGMMKNFQNIQSKMKQMKEDLSQLEVVGRSSCGQVEVILSGDMNLKNVSITPAMAAVNNNTLLEASVSEAVASALMQVKAEAASRLSEATGGVKLPGIFD